MSDNKVFLFGSFTEDESRLFQSKSVQKSNVSPSQKKKLNQTVEKIDLQFGSLDVVSLNSVKRFGQEPKQTSRLVKLTNVESPTLLTKSTAVENGKSPVNSNLQEDSKAQAKLISNGLSVSGIADNGKDALDINSSHICEETTQDVETPVVDPKLTDALAIANGVACELPKDVNEIIQTAMPLKPAVSIGKELHDLALPAKNLLPRGLVNLGNLCFLNATLQALLSCPPFVQLLQDLANRDIPKIGYPTLLAFVEFITDFAIPDNSKATKPAKVLQLGKPFSPAMFDYVLKIFTPDLPTSLSGRPRQEDAQEFLSFVMDRMHDELLKLQGHLLSSNGGRLPLVSSSEEDGWETVGPKNKSAVTRTQSFIPSELSSIFGGQLRSVVKARGNKASATVQPFLLLHLDILPDAVQTIEDALHLFSARETLEGYRASAGKTGVVSASKSVKIQTLSKILILHLMRFSYGSRGSAKLHKPVHFPLELVLARDLLVTPTSEGRKYELVATITHHGQDPSKGHYTADTRFSSEQWLRYDDSSVTAVGTNKVLHDQAYVLFYKQL